MRISSSQFARQYGSGGKPLGDAGKKTGNHLLYASRSFSMASEDSGINEKLFGHVRTKGAQVKDLV